MSSLSETKVCTGCGESKPLDNFYYHKTTKDHRNSSCKECDKLRTKKWVQENARRKKENDKTYYQKNSDAIKNRSKDYYKNNTEHHKLLNKQWRKNNFELYKEHGKKYYRENSQLVKDNAKKWRENNPENYLLSSRKRSRTRRARKLFVGSEKYTEQTIFERWGTDCHICGDAIDLSAPRRVGSKGWEFGLHLDHVIAISKGGPDTIDNVKPAHGLCNLRKNAS